MQPRRIVCPIDFSAPSRDALDAALSLAERFDVPLLLLHAWDVTPFLAPGSGPLPCLRDVGAIQASLAEELEGWRAEAEERLRRPVAAQLVEGPPWERIVDLTGPDDLVVVGTHGRTGLRRALLGSVAERVVRHACGPVLTVRPSGSGSRP